MVTHGEAVLLAVVVREYLHSPLYPKAALVTLSLFPLIHTIATPNLKAHIVTCCIGELIVYMMDAYRASHLGAWEKFSFRFFFLNSLKPVYPLSNVWVTVEWLLLKSEKSNFTLQSETLAELVK